MNLRAFLLMVVVTTLIGCSHTDKPTNSVTRNPDMPHPDSIRLTQAQIDAGIKCYRERIKTGSRFKRKVCTTKEQRESLVANARWGLSSNSGYIRGAN